MFVWEHGALSTSMGLWPPEQPMEFDRSPSSDKRPKDYFSVSRVRRRMNSELNFPPNFERLVLDCIDSYDSNQILVFIFSGFSRSTRFSYFCTALISKFQQKKSSQFCHFWMIWMIYSFKISWKRVKIGIFLRNIDEILSEFHERLQKM